MIVIKNGQVKTMAEAEFQNGCVLIGDNGKILSVGEHIEDTAEMTVIDAGACLVTPGCVEAHCHIGVRNSAMRREGTDNNEKSDPLTTVGTSAYVTIIDGEIVCRSETNL